ncbi:GTPase Era [Alkalibacter rhizosphaerae]|uniref:GTPase Era n=1 Tax=Alkalibacter rhizosphaerae TaxID=2815577 RepID=A0A974XEL6_9FIRM|nr:GTPase Era [Alkalibacter rhizosphaerae]QSX08398.1 GTPase Era [Alkalibacter rhizosphaerae]
MGFKSGFIAIIGRPNVGKSTLLNNILGEKMVIISSKPQTTRNVIRCVHTTDEAQMVFLDTPGIHKPKNKLGERMVDGALSTLREVDLVLFLMDDMIEPGPGDRYILELLKEVKTPKFLVINKIDLFKKEELLEKIRIMGDYALFEEIVPISADRGENVDRLKELMTSYLPDGPMYFPADTITEQPEKVIVAELIREKALQSLNEEVPHGIAVEIMSMKERKGGTLVDIEANIYTEKKSHKGIIIGKNGAMLKKIGTKARRDMENLLGVQVNLQLWVKVKEDWRDRDFDLKNFGYGPDRR